MMMDTDNALSLTALVGRAESLIDRQRYSQAKLLLGEGLKSHPDDPSLLYLSAFVDWVEDRLDDADATLERLLQVSPENYGGRILLGRLLAERKNLSGAEQVWIDLLRSYPEEPDLYAEYGDLMLRTMHMDKAQQLAAEGLRHDPEHEGCLFVAAMSAMIDGRAIGENKDLADLLGHHPERLRSGLSLVVALSDRGDNRAALRVAQQLLRSKPNSPELLANVRLLKAATHWSMLPLYPIQRWGWPAAIAIWLLFAFGLPMIASGIPRSTLNSILVIWLLYVVYSWVWPPILRRII